MTPVNAAVSSLFVSLLVFATGASAVIISPGKQIEKLNRGVVAISTANGAFISWRLLATDEPGTMFNLYPGTSKLNSAPLQET